MIDERFSANSFASRGLDSEGARELADLLAEEILKEMDDVVKARFLDVVNRLNAMGHDLKSEGALALGEVSYRDEHEDERGCQCKLRVAFDSVVSTGYAHLMTSTESSPEEISSESRQR